MCLLEEGEELDGLLALQPEAILLRWFNYHLERVSDVAATAATAAIATAAIATAAAAVDIDVFSLMERRCGCDCYFFMLRAPCFIRRVLSFRVFFRR